MGGDVDPAPIANVSNVIAQEFNAQLNVWQDKGAGHLRVSKLTAQKPNAAYANLEWVNSSTKHVITEPIKEETQFMFDRGCVLLLLRQGDALDVAFTFPNAPVLNSVLDALTKCQDHVSTQHQMTFPAVVTFEVLPAILDLVCNVSGRSVPYLSSWLLQQGALRRLFDLFGTAAQNGDHRAARHIEGVMHACVLSCDRQLLDAITAEEMLWSGLAMVSDYCVRFLSSNGSSDVESIIVPLSPRSDRGWKVTEGPHFRFLTSVAYKRLMDFRDASILRYIHQNYRLQYWVDQIIIPQFVMRPPTTSLVAVRTGDWDDVIATLKDMVAQNNILIVYALCGDQQFWTACFEKVNQEKPERLQCILQFVEELVQMAGDAFQTACVDVFRVLGNFGFFDVLSASIHRMLQIQDLDTLTRSSLNLIEKSLGGEGAPICDGLAVRNYVISSCQKDTGYPLFRNLATGAITHPSAACQAWCSAIIRKLVCKGSNFDEPTDDLLSARGNTPSIFQTAALSSVEQEIHSVFRTTILPLWVAPLRGMIAKVSGQLSWLQGAKVNIPSTSLPDTVDSIYQMCQILHLCLEGEWLRACKASGPEVDDNSPKTVGTGVAKTGQAGDQNHRRPNLKIVADHSEGTHLQRESQLLSALVASGLFPILAKFLAETLKNPYLAAGIVRLFSIVLRMGHVGNVIDDCFNPTVINCLVSTYKSIKTRKRNNLLASSLLHFFELIVESNCQPLIISMYEKHKTILADCSLSSDMNWRWQTLYCQAKAIQKAGSNEDAPLRPNLSPSLLSPRRHSSDTAVNSSFAGSPPTEQRCRISDPGVDSFPHSPQSPNKPKTRKPPAWPDSLARYLRGFGYLMQEDGAMLVCPNPCISPTAADSSKAKVRDPLLLREASMVVHPGTIEAMEADEEPKELNLSTAIQQALTPAGLPTDGTEEALVREVSMVAQAASFWAADLQDLQDVDGSSLIDESEIEVRACDDITSSGTEGRKSLSSSLVPSCPSMLTGPSDSTFSGLCSDLTNAGHSTCSDNSVSKASQQSEVHFASRMCVSGSTQSEGGSNGPTVSVLQGQNIKESEEELEDEDDKKEEEQEEEAKEEENEEEEEEDGEEGLSFDCPVLPPILDIRRSNSPGTGPKSPPNKQPDEARKIQNIRRYGSEGRNSPNQDIGAGAESILMPSDRMVPKVTNDVWTGQIAESIQAPAKEGQAAIQGSWMMNRLACHVARNGAKSPDMTCFPKPIDCTAVAEVAKEGAAKAGGEDALFVPILCPLSPTSDVSSDGLGDRAMSFPAKMGQELRARITSSHSSDNLMTRKKSDLQSKPPFDLTIPQLGQAAKSIVKASPTQCPPVTGQGGATLRFKQIAPGRNSSSPRMPTDPPSHPASPLTAPTVDKHGAGISSVCQSKGPDVPTLPGSIPRWRFPERGRPGSSEKPPLPEGTPDQQRPRRKHRASSVHTDQSSLILQGTYQGHTDYTVSLRRGNTCSFLECGSSSALLDDFEGPVTALAPKPHSFPDAAQPMGGNLVLTRSWRERKRTADANISSPRIPQQDEPEASHAMIRPPPLVAVLPTIGSSSSPSAPRSSRVADPVKSQSTGSLLETPASPAFTPTPPSSSQAPRRRPSYKTAT